MSIFEAASILQPFGDKINHNPILGKRKNIRSAEALRIHYGVDNGTRTHDLQSHNLTP